MGLRRRTYVRPSQVDFLSLSRPDKTAFITEAVVQYWIGKRYSCHIELGLKKRGHLRADVFCLNTKSDTVITEVKSCWQDFKTDKKWQNYKPFCMRMYFAIDETLFATHGTKILEAIEGHSCGLIVIDALGNAAVRSNARRTKMKNEVLARMLIKCAWRGGRFS